MTSGRTSRGDDDPFDVLGVPASADEAAITAARRRLAKQAHPDAGGSIDAMQRINDAADRAISAASTGNRAGSGQNSSARRPPQRKPTPRYRGGAVRHDHPSFTVEALPVEAYEGILIAAGWLGTVADDDPPYLLETVLDEPMACWCRLQLVPDAGASTVSLTVARVPGHATPDIDEVRDRWLRALNLVDWSTLDPNQPRPW